MATSRAGKGLHEVSRGLGQPRPPKVGPIVLICMPPIIIGVQRDVLASGFHGGMVLQPCLSEQLSTCMTNRAKCDGFPDQIPAPTLGYVWRP